jgi:hypothetical protein
MRPCRTCARRLRYLSTFQHYTSNSGHHTQQQRPPYLNQPMNYNQQQRPPYLNQPRPMMNRPLPPQPVPSPPIGKPLPPPDRQASPSSIQSSSSSSQQELRKAPSPIHVKGGKKASPNLQYSNNNLPSPLTQQHMRVLNNQPRPISLQQNRPPPTPNTEA